MSTNFVSPQLQPSQAKGSTSEQQNAYAQPQPAEGYSQGYNYQQPAEGYSQGCSYQQPSQPAANYARSSYPTSGYATSQPPQGYSNPQWNVLAILSVVFLFVLMPASLVLGILALSEIKKTGERGKALAIASICVSGFFVALLVMVFFAFSLFWMVTL